MRCSAPSDGSTSRRSAFTPRTMRPRSTTTRCAMPGTACARQRGSRSTANTTLAFEWMDLAPPGETFWAQIPSSTPRSPGTSERAGDRSDIRAEFFAFPTAPSGLCKENIEESWSRAKVRSLRRAAPCRLGDGFRTNRHQGEFVVWLIVYYVVFMITGDIAAYLIGLITEREFGGQVSLIVFLTLYFLFLWVSWVLAVWMTEPKHVEPVGTKSV